MLKSTSSQGGKKIEKSSLDKASKTNLMKFFYCIGWFVAVLLAIIIALIVSDIMSKAAHLGYTFQTTVGEKYLLDASDTAGKLFASVPLTYTKEVADYLYDQMTRYLRFYSNETDTFVLRPDTRIENLIFTQNMKELSCVILENTKLSASIVLFKGTTTKYELQEVDAKYTLTPWAPTPGISGSSSNLRSPSWVSNPGTDAVNIFVHSGFERAYNGMRNEIRSSLSKLGHRAVYICGHSLGAGLATLCSYDLTLDGYTPKEVYTVTAGGPRVGNASFARYFQDKNVQLYQPRNMADVIPTLPFSQTPSLSGKKQLFQYTHAGEGLLFYKVGFNLSYCHAIIRYQENTDPKGLTSFTEM
jgi:hypothetical protein